MWRAILKEPFVHFLVLGAGVFVLHAAIGTRISRGTAPVASTEAVVVDRERVALVRERLTQQSGRSPSSDEITAELRLELREERLYREALALGLDRDDSLLRRHLADKLEFLAADLVRAPPIGQAELRAAYAKDRDRYRDAKRISFRQLLVAGDVSKGVETAAAELYRELSRGSVDYAQVAKRATPSMLPERMTRADASAVAHAFGDEFAREVLHASAPGWLAPVRSSFGLHLVEVAEVVPATTLPFERAEQRIRDDLEQARQRSSAAALYRKLRDKYPARLEGVALEGLEQAW